MRQLAGMFTIDVTDYVRKTGGCEEFIAAKIPGQL
jgi:hypothetical protein